MMSGVLVETGKVDAEGSVIFGKFVSAIGDKVSALRKGERDGESGGEKGCGKGEPDWTRKSASETMG
ncbi:hypothetical protein V6N12_069297 [Hibiscus sabdariffa]|uniref:Uncharacterized protein n=1 Tax=Hibiscus sabdariffa TaxID=183260 RepID=A0ABR2FDF5_9ROSI